LHLFCRANLRSAERSAEERGKDTKIK
jgi:hypothetical protein